MNVKTLTAGTLLASMLVLGGCASTAEMTKMRDDIAAAQASADAAAAKADAASQEAAAARAIAEQAQSDANAALTKSQETEAKIDRMFKKAMYK